MARLHPLSAAVDALRSGGRLALFALFAGTAFAGMGGGGDVAPLAFLAIPAAFLVGAGIAVARWYRFQYEVLPEHLLVRSGVLARQEREIPLRRIQNVDVRRSVLQRALGLATLRVETAGGSSTEAELDALSVPDAERLRDELGRRGRRAREAARGERTAAGAETATDREAGSAGAGVDETDTGGPSTGTAGGVVGVDDDEPERETLYELSGLRFAVLCAVSFRPGAVFAPFVGASLFDDLVFDAVRLLVRFGVVDVDLGGGLPTIGRSDLLPLVAVSVAAFLLVVWVVSGLLTFVRYYGFRLERVGDELRYERGLLGRYSGNVPLSKVQTVTVSENVAMRRLGYAGLAVDTAGYAPGSNGDDGGSETAVPLDTRERVVALAADVRRELGDGERSDDGRTPSASESNASDAEGTLDASAVEGSPVVTEATDPFDPATVERPPKRARRRYVARYAIATLAVTALAVAVDRFLFDLPQYLPLVPLVGLLLAPPMGHLTWANRGHATVDDGFVTRTGTLRRHTRLVPYFRLQTLFVTRSPFQRRRDLASVIGDSASSSRVLGGDATAYDLDEREADALREELLDRLRADLTARRRARAERFRGPGGTSRAVTGPEGDGSTPSAGNGTEEDGGPTDGRTFEWGSPADVDPGRSADAVDAVENGDEPPGDEEDGPDTGGTAGGDEEENSGDVSDSDEDDRAL